MLYLSRYWLISVIVESNQTKRGHDSFKHRSTDLIQLHDILKPEILSIPVDEGM